MTITFIQTAEAVIYRRMLEVTSQTVREYCSRHNCHYDSFLGIKRGSKPWHAALNRIPMLKGYLDSGYDGWIVYLDSDAFIVDFDFDLHGYLAEKSDHFMIAALSGLTPPQWWDINNGVFMLNMTHPDTASFVNRINDHLNAISDEDLNSERAWGEVVDDQGVFHKTLQDMPSLERSLYLDREDPPVLNYKSSFIRQFVRTTGTVEQRTRTIEKNIEEVMAGIKENPDNAVRAASHDAFIKAVYRALLDREPDPAGYDAMFDALKNHGRSYESYLTAFVDCEEFRSKRAGTR